MPSNEEIEEKKKELQEGMEEGEELNDQDVLFHLCQ